MSTVFIVMCRMNNFASTLLLEAFRLPTLLEGKTGACQAIAQSPLVSASASKMNTANPLCGVERRIKLRLPSHSLRSCSSASPLCRNL